MDYTKYTVEDLASDEGFIQWANRSNADAELFWDDFVAKHPEMDLTITRARTLVLNLRRAESRSESNQRIDALWDRIDEQVTRDTDRAKATSGNRTFSFAFSAAAVVTLVIAAAIGWYLLAPLAGDRIREQVATATSDADYIEEVNTSGDVLRIHLSDGSTVALGNNSRLRYRKSFDGASIRSVYLTGEAFFEVSKDPGRPFLVHTNDVVTRVLGTSFRVQAPDDNDAVVVSVKTGKVSVYTVAPGGDEEASQKNAIILLPNQQVTYLRDNDSFGKTIVKEPAIVTPSVTPADFNFENTPIKKVFNTLELAYGIDIIFDEDVMSNCFITAPLGSEPLFEKLRIICRTIGAHYETIDAKVVVTSTGC